MPKISNLQKCVIVIMLGFAAYLVYHMGSHRSMSAEAQALQNVHVLGIACRQYASDHQDNLPPSLDVLVPTYLKDRSALASPLNPNEPNGYTYTPGYKAAGPINDIFIEDKFAPAHHRIVTYVDGSSRVLNVP